MINGLGVVGWGVGGIEAEAGMLGQPVYFLTPDVVGVHLTGALREGVTATDLALTITEKLRAAKVVGKFVEFYGPGAKALPLVDRATIANMAPEYGATMGFFPIDEETVQYLKTTGRSGEHCQTYENYYRAQGLFGLPAKGDIDYSTDIELDLASVGLSGRSQATSGSYCPARPQTELRCHLFKACLGRRVRQGRFSVGSRRHLSQGCGSRSFIGSWQCVDCRHHQLHQYLQSWSDAGCRPFGQECGRTWTRQPCGQGFACPGFTCGE